MFCAVVYDSCAQLYAHTYEQFLKLTVSFYSARNAHIASAVLATAIPSVCLSVRPSLCLSVCLSVRHTPVLCQNDGTQHGAVCTIG